MGTVNEGGGHSNFRIIMSSWLEFIPSQSIDLN